MLAQGVDRMTNGLKQEFTRLNAISQNQANLDTPGFRQTLTGLRQGKMDLWRDDTEGTVKDTGRDLDIAPAPGTYFEVQQGNQTLLTTRGDLARDQQGFLTVGSGERILDTTGSPIPVASLQSLSIDDNGIVYDGGKPQATIRRVQVSSVKELGGTLFTAADNATIVEDQGQVNLGMLLTSNADLTRNQTDLVATIHRAKIYSQAATLQDSTIDRAIREMLAN